MTCLHRAAWRAAVALYLAWGACAVPALAQALSGGQEAEALLQLFRTTQDANVRWGVAGRLADAYGRAPDGAARSRIDAMLTELLRAEKDPQVGRQLALAHARLPFGEHTLANLRWARAQGFIAPDDYHGQLALVLPEAPPQARGDLLRELAAGHSGAAAEALADWLALGPVLARDEARTLQPFMARMPPRFRGTATTLELTDSVRMQNWLQAMGLLQELAGGAPREAFAVQWLQRPGTDPRAVLAYLALPQARELAGQLRWAPALRRLAAQAQAFARRHPEALDLQKAAADARR